MIVALAGRRIDNLYTSEVRFPHSQISNVKKLLDDFFTSNKVTQLICAGACGADLVAIEVALGRKIKVTMVLPFDAATFRNESVVDRGEEWGNAFEFVKKKVTL